MRGYAASEWAPIADGDITYIARSCGADVCTDELGAHTQEIAVPPYLGGRPRIVVNRYIQRNYQRLALRHGLAHLLAGDLALGEGGDLRYMASWDDYMAIEERRSDLFALADLIPDRDLDVVAGSPLISGKQLLLHLRAHTELELRRLAPDWPARRIRDRVNLRVDLYTDWRG